MIIRPSRRRHGADDQSDERRQKVKRTICGKSFLSVWEGGSHRVLDAWSGIWLVLESLCRLGLKRYHLATEHFRDIIQQSDIDDSYSR
jgi:hypothetical protein